MWTMSLSCAPAVTLAPMRGIRLATSTTAKNTTALVAPGRRRRRPNAATTTTTSRCAANYNPTDRVSELQSEGAYAVLAAAQALERQGRDIVHLEIGQPGFPSPPHVVQAGVDAIKGGQTKCVSTLSQTVEQRKIQTNSSSSLLEKMQQV